MDKFISDSKAMYDQLYSEYETVLMKRLDNIDKLFSDVIDAVNASAGTIASELYNTVDSVGYTTSEAFNTTWQGAYNSIKGDSDKRLTQVTEEMDKLIAEGKLSPEDKQSILDALGKGDVTSVKDVLELINTKVADGSITTDTANKLRASMSVTTDMQTALESLNLVSDMQEAGLITGEMANQMRDAIIGSEKKPIPVSMQGVLTDLIAKKQISISEGSSLISALTGQDENSVRGALQGVSEAVESGLLSESQAIQAYDAIISGDQDQLSSVLGVLDTVTTTNEKDAETIENLRNQFQNLVDARNDSIKSATDTAKGATDTAQSAIKAAEEATKAANAAEQAVDEYLQRLVDEGIITKEQMEFISAGLKSKNEAKVAAAKAELYSAIEDAVKSGKIDTSKAQGLVNEFDTKVVKWNEATKNAALAMENAAKAIENASAQAKSAGTGNVTIQVVSTYDDKNFNNTTTSQAVDETFKTATEVQRGDFDQNGVVNSSDAAYLSRLLAQGKTDIIAQIPKETDFNGDNKLDVRDAAALADWLAHKKNQLQYAKGAKRINTNTTAWTQENGEEYIIRPSDGAILTPLARNDSVLTASATSNIWNMANDPEKFIRENIKVGGDIPATIDNSTINYTGGDMQITLPNVQSYEDFKYAMQHDKSFETMVRSMTVDRLFGKSSLRKYKV